MLRVPSEIKADQFESLKIQESTFVAYRSNIYPSKNDVFFEENAVLYILEGDKIFSSSNSEVRVKKGDVLFVKRGYYLMSESIDESYKSLVFFFEEKLLKEFVSQHLEIFQTNSQPAATQNSWLLVLQSNEAFGKYIDSLLPYFKTQSRYHNQILKLKLQELLLHLLEFDRHQQLRQLLFSIYAGQKADLDYIVDTFAVKPLNINELARLSGRSLSSFKRDFIEKFSQSPGKYIKDKKLEHAAFMLKNKLGNVEQVSESIGYESVSHFIKGYKEKFGQTPFQSVKEKES
ncbi:MAG: helix-turn-helix transcriptional regulator [Cytophagaceae bacterium]|nr:helix-turn-helix transcriptional regulator [Cytophagaceae bacterium]